MGGFNQYPEYKNSGLSFIKEVPKHWEVRRTKLFFKEIDERSELGDEELLSVSHITGVTRRSDKKNITMFMAESYEGFKLCHPGDLVINIMWAWMGALGVSRYRGIVSSAYGVYRQRKEKKFISEYLDYLVRLPELIAEHHRCSKGIRPSRLRMYSNDFFQLYLFCPPLEEQRTIVHFINQKLAQVEQFICYKRRLIELLNEQKKAVIARAVTKGIEQKAPMKQSGIEWLGEVPCHWELRKVKYLAKILRGKFTHRPRNDPRLYDGNYPFIQTGDVANAEKYIVKYSQTLNEEGFAVSKLFPKGTLVVTIAANIADVAILDFDACFPDSIIGFVPRNLIQLDYLYSLFSAMRQEFLSIAPENTQLNLNVERVGSSITVFPPSLQEQTELLNYVETESGKIDEVIAQAEKEIDLLQEYRTTLISDAITGKIDVRDTIKLGFPAVAGEV